MSNITTHLQAIIQMNEKTDQLVDVLTEAMDSGLITPETFSMAASAIRAAVQTPGRSLAAAADEDLAGWSHPVRADS
jgi:predicted RNA-binding protein associated with RNAse of E/G family